MNLNEKNNVLAAALDDIKCLVTEHCGGHPDDIEAQYDCNKAAFDQIAKILANAMRLDVFGDDLPAETYFTPEAITKFLNGELKVEAPPAEQPIDPNGPTLNQILKNPPFKRGAEEEARERFGRYLSVPALGMQFRRYRSANTTILVATWRDDVNSHVYVLRVERDGDTPNCGWRALATNDGRNVFQLRTKSRHNCEHFALAAMKRYLKCGHRKTYRTLAKKEGK